ncbi:MAG: AGE family epimerase/isomerase [Bacteroidota bacterium]
MNTIIAKNKLDQLQLSASNELDEILQWWKENMLDNEHEGFYGQMDGNNQLFPDAHKGIILNTRLLWSYSAASRINKNAGYKALADRAYQYILDHFWDVVYGGVYWMLDHQGELVNGKKQIYAQSFAIYAFSEYYLLTKIPQSREKAIELFWLIERYSRDSQLGGYYEAFSEEWDHLDDLRLSEHDINEAKTMNTHLHVLEAYTNLYRIYQHESLKQAIVHLINCFKNKFINPLNHHLQLFFDESWQLKSHEISFGHDIEASWLLYEAAEVIGDPLVLESCKKLSVDMTNAVIKRGLDLDGSLFNEGHGNAITDDDKIWWTQAEAVVGFMNAFQLTGNLQYLENALSVWQFIEEYIKDDDNGEWFWRTDKVGTPIKGKEDKAGLWKAPYHNSRACIETIRRIDSIKKEPV